MEKKLNRIGKRCFEQCYQDFDMNMRGIITDEEVVRRVMHIMDCTESGAKIRASYAKQIFKAGQHNEALAAAKARTK